MAFKDRFPKPTLIFLGISCEITDWKSAIIDFQSDRIVFSANCNLTAGGNTVYLQNCQFTESLEWELAPGINITASEFNLSRIGENAMQVNFAIPLSQVEALLALPG